MIVEASRPPRLLGTDCGCFREKLDSWRWQLIPCETHKKEISAKGLELLDL